MPQYAVLTDISGSTSVNPAALGSRTFSLRSSGPGFPEPRIRIETLDARGVRELGRDPDVADMAPIMPTRVIAPVKNDAADAEAEAANNAWGIDAVGATGSNFDGSGVTVAVLDTGIDADHPAFQGIGLVQRDFSGDGDGDVSGHGTHCAGTIAGRDVDGKRIGVARGVPRMLIGKVLGNDGSGSSEMAFQGIQWAVENGANVISMSLGFDFPGLVKRLIAAEWPADLATSAALEGYRSNIRMFDSLMGMIQARAAFGSGTVVVAAAGNESRRELNADYEIATSIPAAAQGIISVGALGQGADGLTVAKFSNTFPKVSAPGVGILSAKAGGGLRSLNGTSMACPHVSGIAALWWQAVRELPIPANSEAVIARILATAQSDDIAPGEDIADRGAGIVSAP